MAQGAPGRGRKKGGPASPTAGGVVLPKVQEMTPEEHEKAKVLAEVKAGLRCDGCERRVTHAFEFTFIQFGKVDGRTFANYTQVVACSGADGKCDHAAVMAQDERCVAMREVKQRFIDTPEMRELLGKGKKEVEADGGDGGG